MAERKQELEKRLQDVSGVLGTAKKSTKKGAFLSQHQFSRCILTEIVHFLFLFIYFIFFIVDEAAKEAAHASRLSSSSSTTDSTSSSSSDSSSSDTSDSEAG